MSLEIIPLYCSKGNHYWAWNFEDKKYSIVQISNFEDKKRTEIICPGHFDFGEHEQDGYIARNFKVTNPKGIHARPSAEILMFAVKYDLEFAIRKEVQKDYILLSLNGQTAKANSFMGIMGLGIEKSDFEVLFPKSIDKKLLEDICLGIYHAATIELN